MSPLRGSSLVGDVSQGSRLGLRRLRRSAALRRSGGLESGRSLEWVRGGDSIRGGDCIRGGDWIRGGKGQIGSIAGGNEADLVVGPRREFVRGEEAGCGRGRCPIRRCA